MKITSIYIHFLDVFNTNVSIKQLWLLIVLEIYFVTLGFFQKHSPYLLFTTLSKQQDIILYVQM